MSFDIHDAYQRAQFGLIPPRIIKEIKTRLLFDDSLGREIMHQMLGWNYNDIVLYEKTGDRDPLQKMFDKMNTHEPECVITCADVDNHFRAKKCFPIIKVHSVLKPLTPVFGFLEKEDTINEVVKEIRERRNNQDLYPNAREFKTDTNENDLFFDYTIKPTRFQWLKNLIAKKANVLVVNLTATDNASISTLAIDEAERKENFSRLALCNLVENLDRNFKCVVTPHVVTQEWENFIDGQFIKASFLVSVFSESCVYNIAADSLNGGLSFLDAHQTYLWNKMTTSALPMVGVVFDKSHQIEAEKYLIPIFLLPKEMEFLLNFISEF